MNMKHLLLNQISFNFQVYSRNSESESLDSLVFVDLLKKTFDVDGSQRISPKEALRHDFITMRHLQSCSSE